MKLRDYFNAERGRQSALARAINVHVPDVCRWADGTRPVPEKYGALIEQATDGAVTRKDLFPDNWRTIWPELDDAGLRRRRSDRIKRRATDKTS